MAKTIMLQGTMSNVGKSYLCAGLCRIFRQDGFRVAPFKAQNMALNSCVSIEGLEMGRAQAVQAEACGIAPSVLMNPVLLKPSSDRGSQVIVNGHIYGEMGAREYFSFRQKLRSRIFESFHKLSQDYDIIVIEGAGSPAEINLMENDIVNMGMARMAGSPVLLVGDIDPGGVFAQLLGTLDLLPPADRKRVRGMIINKFRGDPTILYPGIDELSRRAEKPVLGLVPFTDVSLPEEDSLSGELFHNEFTGGIDICIIRFPRISNFTDFQPLRREKGISVRYAMRAGDLGSPDLLILPGSKNTINDMKWLREKGFPDEIYRLMEEGVPIMGICGGYEMLGEEILDPFHVETGDDEDGEGLEEPNSVEGLCILPLRTILQKEKFTENEMGHINALPVDSVFSTLSGIQVSGYEMHVGLSEIRIGDGCGEGFASLSNGRKDGWVQGNVLGTFLHGIFESDDFRGEFCDILRRRSNKRNEDLAESGGLNRNLTGGKVLSLTGSRDKQFDRLAEILRKSLAIKDIYKIMEEGPE